MSGGSTLAEAQASFNAKQQKAALDKVYADAEKAFGRHNPGRLAQLRGVLDAAEMALDHLATEVPYTLS